VDEARAKEVSVYPAAAPECKKTEPGQLLQFSKPPETTAIGGAHEKSGIDFPIGNAKGLKWTST
jgi:hypothetical protein